MYELVMIVCLMAQPASCEVKRLPFQEPTGIMQCMRFGQIKMQQWLDEHQEWSLKKWHCALPKA